eukprot:CAMPEP_0185259152 /NCGR_PEP_ID=MMETSP1359-20130426/7983_1 /TAXON_ID=552665 /ORGANISM="Bigelowiella longifila, Strain CCMP242" /LENGTH=405 /DNA_ID=CAMNT_0027844953 /DNA_START=44 /DNA_END=1261 /DNA_ORIENTATION=+
MPFSRENRVLELLLLAFLLPFASSSSEECTATAAAGGGETCLQVSEPVVLGNVQSAPTASNYTFEERASAKDYLDILYKERQILTKNARVYEYESVSNPVLNPVPILSLGADDYAANETGVVTADFSSLLGISYPATSPNLLAGFVKVLEGEELDTKAEATSQAFYVVSGSGRSQLQPDGEEEEEGKLIEWATGDMFVVPAHSEPITHTASSTAVLYWVHDEPLLRYLGVKSSEKKFEPTLYTKEMLMDCVEEIKREPGSGEKNRMGILLGNKDTEQTKTITHTLWALLNTIPPKTVQLPHKHNSVALDLCVSAGEGTYTLMSRQIDHNGRLVDPVRMDWAPGGMFVTPPGWWHSHVNEGEQPGWVLPLQDAGIYTYQRSLDIRFAPDSIRHYKEKIIAGVMDQF